MTPNPCPDCGGPLQPPDDFCQRCLDAEMEARRQSGWGYPEATPWFRTSVPFLTFFAVLLVSISDVERAGWRSLYWCMGLTLLAPLVAAWNAIQYARD